MPWPTCTEEAGKKEKREVMKVEETKKGVIWEVQNRDPDIDAMQYHIANPSEVTELANFVDWLCYKFPGIRTEEELLKAIPDLKEIADSDDLEEALEDTGIEYEFAGDAEPAESIVCYDFYEKEIFNLTSCDFVPVYEYWDGSNHRKIWLDETSPSQKIVYSDDYIDLDKWDGENFFYRHKHNHGRIHRLVEIDGKPAENQFILYEYTQFEDDIPVITFISEAKKDELFKASRD